MPYGLWMSAEGAIVQQRRLDVVANNLANANTPAFKRDLLRAQARYAEAIEQGLDYPGSGTIDDVGGGVKVFDTVTEFEMGTLQVTNRPTDMAIKGDGFFMVDHDGKQMLTRAGNFDIRPDGMLVTVNGDPVLDRDRRPIVIGPTPWQVSENGAIEQGGSLSPLALVRPRTNAELVKVGDNLYEPMGTVDNIPERERSVAWQTLEGSSVVPTTEMMEMIEATRAFEANVSMIRNHDQMLGTLISRVLSTR